MSQPNDRGIHETSLNIPTIGNSLNDVNRTGQSYAIGYSETLNDREPTNI